VQQETTSSLNVRLSFADGDGGFQRYELSLTGEAAEHAPYIRSRFDEFLTEAGFDLAALGEYKIVAVPEVTQVSVESIQQGENVIPFKRTRSAAMRVTTAVVAVAATAALATASSGSLDFNGDGVIDYKDAITLASRAAPNGEVKQTIMIDGELYTLTTVLVEDKGIDSRVISMKKIAMELTPANEIIND